MRVAVRHQDTEGVCRNLLDKCGGRQLMDGILYLCWIRHRFNQLRNQSFNVAISDCVAQRTHGFERRFLHRELGIAEQRHEGWEDRGQINMGCGFGMRRRRCANQILAGLHTNLPWHCRFKTL